jgi:N-succinyldiaminopimelate aminotransferase
VAAVNPYVNDRLREFGTTIFAEMSARAVATGSINLGQGFPDTDGPELVKRAAVEAIEAGHNQYPPGIGVPALRHAITAHQQRFYGLEYDPDTEVLVTAGATEAIAATMLSLCGPGDEVVTFEPYYDSYAACIAMAGARRRVVTLRPPDWSFDHSELRDAITPQTKLILVNSPHNPTGKVFTQSELNVVADLAVANDVLVATDEVYEHLVYDGEHVPIATLPGMRDRTVTISSGGKTFSFTGWKVGWVCATPPLTEAVRSAKQFLTYVNGGPFQHAIATGLRLGDDYYSAFLTDMRDKRDRLCAGLEHAGFEVFAPQGTYFVTTDIRRISDEDGLEFCRALPERCGVVAVPSSVFYDDKVAGAPFVRWACCKRPEVLDEAVARLKALAR